MALNQTPNEQPQQGNLTLEQIVAGKMLTTMANKVAAELGTFSSWMIAAAGAMFALALNGVDKLGPYLKLSALSGSIKIFLAAAALNVAQRWLIAMVSSSSAVAKELEEAKLPPDADMAKSLDLFVNALPWPIRFFGRRAKDAVMRGDLMKSPRLLSRIALIQSVLVPVQLILLLASAWRLLP